MTRYYIFKWKENKKNSVERENKITIAKPTGETSIDAKQALNLFTKGFGNLKKNSIISIKEFDENGQIGEDITPSAETSIIPERK